MIQTKHLTPTIYTKMSRDFQLLGSLYDVILNNVKTNADLIYNLPLGVSNTLDTMDLLAMTLGFVPKHKYNSKQLQAVCSALPTIIKNKGSLQSIILLVNTILHAEGIEDSLECSMDVKNDEDDRNQHDEYKIIIGIPDKLQDLNLIYDLLDYLLPAGISYEIILMFTVKISGKTELEYEDKITVGVNQLPTATATASNTYGSLPDLTDATTVHNLIESDEANKSGLSIHETTLSLIEPTMEDENNG